ncbi:hypothetical protein KSP40_PGU014853 [Platanthera guangdongensis]|uniref:Uncharacterized protein n=1 Tax=Platanthera guangdongensis TaxID=2320717 RepID=A0ABR2M8U4_9ASPA
MLRSSPPANLNLQSAGLLVILLRSLSGSLGGWFWSSKGRSSAKSQAVLQSHRVVSLQLSVVLLFPPLVWPQDFPLMDGVLPLLCRCKNISSQSRVAMTNYRKNKREITRFKDCKRLVRMVQEFDAASQSRGAEPQSFEVQRGAQPQGSGASKGGVFFLKEENDQFMRVEVTGETLVKEKNDQSMRVKVTMGTLVKTGLPAGLPAPFSVDSRLEFYWRFQHPRTIPAKNYEKKVK